MSHTLKDTSTAAVLQNSSWCSPQLGDFYGFSGCTCQDGWLAHRSPQAWASSWSWHAAAQCHRHQSCQNLSRCCWCGVGQLQLHGGEGAAAEGGLGGLHWCWWQCGCATGWLTLPGQPSGVHLRPVCAPSRNVTAAPQGSGIAVCSQL